LPHRRQRHVKADPPSDFDAIIIGAGVSGLYQLYKLRELADRYRGLALS
jgi:cation diffusion facilitator CzcD-associated flavoprotein CzcO